MAVSGDDKTEAPTEFVQELGGCLIYFEGVRNGSQALPLIQQACISYTRRHITTQAERNRPNKNAGKRGIGAHIYHSFSRLQSHSIKKESTPRHEFTEEGSTSSACKCSEKAPTRKNPHTTAHSNAQATNQESCCVYPSNRG